MTRRISMWSGPRNISTTMMRAFENRDDTSVVDEPFYAHYLKETGLTHPMRDEVLASQPADWRDVVADLLAEKQTPVAFFKQMPHHLTIGMDLFWLAGMDHFFLIRDPRRMVISFADRMDGKVTPADLGLIEEERLYRQISEMTGRRPPIVDAADILADPKGMLTALCNALDIPFSEKMLAWPAGPRDSDGVWASHWYKSVASSAGFKATSPDRYAPVSAEQEETLSAVMPAYEALYERRLQA